MIQLGALGGRVWRLGGQKAGFMPRLIWQMYPNWQLSNPSATERSEERCKLGPTNAGSMQKTSNCRLGQINPSVKVPGLGSLVLEASKK
eukprot:1155955-Pelagomonas_calceolata.AAC.4